MSWRRQHSQALLGITPQSPGCPACSPVIIPTEVLKILWCNRPMWELLKCRNLETQLHNSSEWCFPLPSPRFPSPYFSTHQALLCDAVNTGVHNTTQCHVLPLVRFRVYKRDWRQFSSVRVRNREFTLVCSESYKWSEVKWSEVEEESLSLWEDLKCDWKTFFMCNIWSVRLLWFVCWNPLLGND
jgi:hypothetical protein